MIITERYKYCSFSDFSPEIEKDSLAFINNEMGLNKLFIRGGAQSGKTHMVYCFVKAFKSFDVKCDIIQPSEMFFNCPSLDFSDLGKLIDIYKKSKVLIVEDFDLYDFSNYSTKKSGNSLLDIIGFRNYFGAVTIFTTRLHLENLFVESKNQECTSLMKEILSGSYQMINLDLQYLSTISEHKCQLT